MKQIYYLVKRNTLNFFRDRSAVFFSVLSTLIILALMVVFLGSMNSASVVDVLAQYGGERDTAADEANAKHLIQMWTLAGILVVNSVTVTLTALGCMVSDETRNRLASFFVGTGSVGLPSVGFGLVTSGSVGLGSVSSGIVGIGSVIAGSVTPGSVGSVGSGLSVLV